MEKGHIAKLQVKRVVLFDRFMIDRLLRTVRIATLPSQRQGLLSLLSYESLVQGRATSVG